MVFALVSGQLDDETDEAVQVVLSSTGRFHHSSAPTEVVPASAAPLITAKTLKPTFVGLVAASSNFSTTTGYDAVALTTSSPTLTPPVPIVQTFLSSPLALSAISTRTLNASASAAVLCVTLCHLRNRLARCDAEYGDSEGRIVAREVGVERLMPEVQSFNQLVTLFHDQDAQRQHLMDSRAKKIASL